MKKHDRTVAEFIFRPYITLPNGVRIYAKQYGLRAFPIPANKQERLGRLS